MAVLIKY